MILTDYHHLTELCKKQDRRGQLGFYSLFCQDVYRSAFRLLGETGEAEEVMQEVLLKILTAAKTIDDDENRMRNRLRKMAVNASIDLLRKRRVNFFLVDEYRDVMPESDPDDWIEIEERVVSLTEAITKLPDGYRSIIQLRIAEELSFEEIGQLLHIAPSSARSQFVRAKQKLIFLMKGE